MDVNNNFNAVTVNTESTVCTARPNNCEHLTVSVDRLTIAYFNVTLTVSSYSLSCCTTQEVVKKH